jgi:hypothetical protein
MYSIGNKPEDVLFTALFGLIGYASINLLLNLLPCCSALCWQIAEEKLRQALIISGGSATTFVSSPLSIGLFFDCALAFISRYCQRSALAEKQRFRSDRSTRVGLIFEFIRCIWTYARAGRMHALRDRRSNGGSSRSRHVPVPL